jgi:integrase
MALQRSAVLRFPYVPHPGNKDLAKRVKFTQVKVEGLRYNGGGRPDYFYDADKPGLAVRLTSGGARTFVFVGRLHGRVARITLGRVENLALAKARQAVDKIRGDIALGVDVLAQRRALRRTEADRKSLNDTFAEFIAGRRHKPKTLQDYKSLWRLHVEPRLGKRPIREVTAEDARRAHGNAAAAVAGRRRAKGALSDRSGHRTANKVAALVRAVLSFAGRKADNPATEVIWFKQRPRRRRLSDAEALQFRQVLEGFEEPWRDFFTLLLLTGVRRQSLLAMRWADLDLPRGRWIVPATWSKNDDEMVIPLTSEVVKLLTEMQRRRGSSPWVFPSAKAKAGHIEEPKAAWARLLRATGIAGLRLHDLRRTFGSRLAESGASGPVIAAAMGHKSLQSARSYLHLQVDAVREAAERAAIKTPEKRDAQT